MSLPQRAALRAAFALLPLLLLAACADAPTAVRTPPPAPARALAELRCAGDARTLTVACELAGESGGARFTTLTLGGQGHYVRVTGSGTAYNAGTDELTSTLKVQNLLAAAIGTADGTTPDPAGVRVFLASQPTNGVTMANPTGVGVFTATGQPYFEYDDDAGDEIATPELGGDGKLAPGETSAGKLWRFAMHGATTFTFTMLVQAEVSSAADAFLHFTTLGGFCGLTASGQAYCWGVGAAVGDGSASSSSRVVPAKVLQPAGLAFVSIARGNAHTCALTAAGQAYCWGTNQFGQIGDSTTTTRTTPVAVHQPPGVTFTALALGDYHSCGLTAAGQAYCWGWDEYGQLGDLSDWESFGGPPQPAPLPVTQPAGVTFASITAGGLFTCGLTAAGQAYCFGESTTLGNGGNGPTRQPTPQPVTQAGGLTFASITAGYAHACGVTSAGSAYCWGENDYGEVGDNTQGNVHSTPTAVSQPAGVTFARLEGAENATCGETTTGQEYCWGRFAQDVGDGLLFDSGRLKPTLVPLPSGESTLSGMTALGRGACALGDSGAAYCWTFAGAQTTGAQPAPAVVPATR